MSTKLEPPKNPNYAATVVELKSFADLAGCVDGLNECQAFKLKNFKFLERESK